MPESYEGAPAAASTRRYPHPPTEPFVLRAFTADDRDAYARMQANPGVMRYLGVGEVPRRAATWPTMAGNLGQWRLRGYGSFALDESAMG